MGQAQSSSPLEENPPDPTTSVPTLSQNSSLQQPSLDLLIAEAAVYGSQETDESLNAEKALECPCISHLRAGPCGVQFSDAFLCFLKSNADEKGSDCVHPFVALQKCIKENPDAFSNDVLEDEEGKQEEDQSS